MKSKKILFSLLMLSLFYFSNPSQVSVGEKERIEREDKAINGNFMA